jgi:hypothetical protein
MTESFFLKRAIFWGIFFGAGGTKMPPKKAKNERKWFE